MITHMRSLKPGINLNPDSDAHVRLAVTAGLGEGLVGDIRATYLDIFPSSAREDALNRFKADNRLPDVTGAQWKGTVTAVGIDGALVSPGDVLIAESGERSYRVTVGGTIAMGTVDVTAEADQVGSDYNLDIGELLTFDNPPPNVQDTASVAGTTTQGSNTETVPELRTRIIDHDVQEPAGGNATDYEREALAASPDVLTAIIDRNQPQGAGRLDLYISAGTTNIDEAVDNGDPVLRLAPAPLIAEVQVAIDREMVTTDTVTVRTYTEQVVDVPVFVDPLPGFVIGGGGPTDITETIQKVVQKYLYGLEANENESVIVRVSDIEALLDSQKGITIKDRKVPDLGAGVTNLELDWGILASPGTITVSQFV